MFSKVFQQGARHYSRWLWMAVGALLFIAAGLFYWIQRDTLAVGLSGVESRAAALLIESPDDVLADACLEDLKLFAYAGDKNRPESIVNKNKIDSQKSSRIAQLSVARACFFKRAAPAAAREIDMAQRPVSDNSALLPLVIDDLSHALAALSELLPEGTARAELSSVEIHSSRHSPSQGVQEEAHLIFDDLTVHPDDYLASTTGRVEISTPESYWSARGMQSWFGNTPALRFKSEVRGHYLIARDAHAL